MEINNKQEQMFTEVAEAYANAGKKMDDWTTKTYTNLQSMFSRYGNLSANQEKLLLSLTKYIPKSPDVNSKKTKVNKQLVETQITQSLLTQTPKRFENVPQTPDNVTRMEWIMNFEAKLKTAWSPTKEEIFQYGAFSKMIGMPYSPPNRWKDEFTNYYFRMKND